MTKLNVTFKKIDREFIDEFGVPKYSTDGSAGLDLRINLPERKPLVLGPGETYLASTGLAIFIHNINYAGFVYPRSGQGMKRGIVLANLVGVIDSDYQGELKVPLWNRSNKPVTIEHGERIAQLIIQRVTQVTLEEVEEFDEISDRGAGGFGSTGQV